MTDLELLELLGEIDGKFISENKKVKTFSGLKYSAVAACICLVIAGSAIAFNINNTLLPSENLQLISIDFKNAGMGFEGLMYYDESEIVNANPWNEDMNIKALPVYKNLGYNEYGLSIYLDEETMRGRVEEVSDALGITLSEFDKDDHSIQVGENEFISGITRLNGKNENVTVRAFGNGSVYIIFENGAVVPDEYSFTHDESSDSEAKKALKYIYSEYKDVFDFKKAKLSTYFSDYNIYADRNREYVLYDASGNDIQDILNYNFNSAEIYPEYDEYGNSTGRISSIRTNDGLACAEKVGDYPLITASEAQALLFEGKYFTSVPHDIVATDTVAKVELVYRWRITSEYFVPMYKFYVPLSGEESGHKFDKDNGLVTYGVYYVPAIPQEYVSDMPTDAGRIN